MLCGLFINGPYAVITTAVSNDLVSKHNYTHSTIELMHNNNTVGAHCNNAWLKSLSAMLC